MKPCGRRAAPCWRSWKVSRWETGRADLAAVFRQALTQELGSPPHLLDLRITKKKRGKK
jgi:hypothetical protein